MKLSELDALVTDLQHKRDQLHSQLHAHLADEAMPVGIHRAKEQAIRGPVRDVMGRCYPLQVVLAKTRKIVSGKALTDVERAEYERCAAIVGAVEIG